MLFAAMPIVYQEHRGWSEGKGGLSFLGITLGIVFASITVIPIYFNYRNKTTAAKGRLAPEERLPSAMFGAISLTVGLFWFAWTIQPSIHWMASIAAGVPLGYGMVMVFLPVLNYLIDSYTIYAASVLAGNVAMRSLFGAAFPLFTGSMYGNLGINWASSIPAFLSLVCVPMPFLFYRYGERIRRRCHYSAISEAFMEKTYGKIVSVKNVKDESSAESDGLPR